MTDQLEHRGPDAAGYFVEDNVALGHRRLSIIDLSEGGAQPMTRDSLTVTYNGELYNYKELRKELEELGHHFSSGSDTEVLIGAYKEWGSNCTTRFNGMWAFVIYDRNQEEFFFSRDRFGIKPLYYIINNGSFYFASEIKAFRPLSFLKWSFDSVGLNQFFYQKYTSAPFTIYDEIKMLPPGHQGTFSLRSKKLSLGSYYNLAEEVEKASSMSQEELSHELSTALLDAVRCRMIADVPIGSFLSGGLDSSAISAWAQKILEPTGSSLRTFSLGFDDPSYDESSFAKTVADHLKTEHTVDIARPNIELWRSLQEHLDEPFGDASIIPTTLLSEMTKKHVTVALSGDAGDELFGGYDTHRAWMVAKSIPKIFKEPLKLMGNWLPVDYQSKVSWSFKFQRFTRDLSANPLRRHLDWMATFTDEPRKKLLGAYYLPSEEVFPIFSLDPDDFRSIQYLDIQYYLPGDILKKVDIASMYHSLEARVPFLDYRVVPLALALSTKEKLNLRDQKIWLKKQVEPILPPSILKRSKRGFTVPINKWLELRSEEERREKWMDFFPRTDQGALNEFEKNPASFARERWLIEQFIGSVRR